MKTSIILPSYGRPAQLRKCVENILDTTTGLDVEVIVVLDNEEESYAAVSGFPIRILNRPARGSCITAWNDGAHIAEGDVFVSAADDFLFYPNWLHNALEHLKEGNFVALNDLHHGDELATIFLLTRKYGVKLGGVIYCPRYKGFFCDAEVTARAKEDDEFVWAQDAIAEHRHWTLGKSVKDATYEDRDGFWDMDMKVYQYRKTWGWPNDFLPSFGEGNA